MHYHIILTENCNSQCKYCYGKVEFNTGIEKRFEFKETSQDLNINLEDLKNFLKKDPNPVLIFYGGEPLLKSESIIKIINTLSDLNIKFRMQTNGKLLDKLPIQHLKKIDKILISIDGNKERTDHNRGIGTYDLIIKNIKKIRKEGYSGELVARMTLSPSILGGEKTYDIFNQVMHILNLGLFDSVHWQLDLGFYKHDFNKEKLAIWSKKYNACLDKLINWWVEEIKKGKVWKIYPFIGLVDALIFDGNPEGKLMCGAGHAGYSINTDGEITPCPIMVDIKEFIVGNLKSDPNKLKKIEINECNTCEYKKYCGGRCLFWRKMKLWSEEGDKMICDLIKHLIDQLRESIKGVNINKEDINYEKYFGPEIIP